MKLKIKQIGLILAGIILLIVLTAVGIKLFGTVNHQVHNTVNTTEHTVKKEIYYCPMHPHYTSDRPGECPICGMKLVLKQQDNQPMSDSMEPGTVMIATDRQKMIGLRTATVELRNMDKTIRAVGKIEYDERKQVNVTTKIEGWIEKLFVDYTGKLVQKGQSLFTIYSPELVAAQQEYLLALKSKNYLGQSPYSHAQDASKTLIDSARTKLKLWDISENDISLLEKSGEIRKTLTIYSPGNGIVVEKMAVEGMKVIPGDNLFKLVDIQTVWLIADIYEYELPLVKIGQKADITLSNIPGKTFKGTLSYIYPFLEEETRTAKVRFELNNPGFILKPGMFANVDIQTPQGTRLVIPSNALIDTGTKQYVVLALENNHFKPQVVTVGQKYGEYQEILSGIESGDAVVTQANFLIDSESQMKAALQRFEHPH